MYGKIHQFLKYEKCTLSQTKIRILTIIVNSQALNLKLHELNKNIAVSLLSQKCQYP